MEYFKNEPECGTLEENRAECTRCGKFVALGRRQKYTIRPWEIHRVRCDQKPPKSLLKELGKDMDVHGEQDDGSVNTKMVSVLPKTTEQRKTFLEADPNISVVKPNEVLCRNCGSWIRLSTKQAYKDSNWKTHSLSCKAVPTASPENYKPSTRVATATRKLQLVNDPQIKSFTTHAVVCSFCDESVASDSKEDYSIVDWELHKGTCKRPLSESRKTPPGLTDISTIPFPKRPPPSSASVSTEDTLIASDLHLNTHGSKRPREIEEGCDISSSEADARPSNRPRTNAYQAPLEGEASPANWLMLPFKAFVRGFKESLKHP
jgi:hypothetical protein